MIQRSEAEVLTLTNEQYHADSSSISNSSKEVFRKDRLAYYAQYVTGSMPRPEQTPAQELGEFVHMALLEPERFVNETVVPPKFDRRTKDGKAGFAAFAQECAGKRFIDAETDATVKIVREAAYANKEIRTILERDGLREHTISWICSDTWLSLKSRRDLVFPDEICDLKTCDRLTAESFAASMARFGYPRQAAFYIDGEAHLTGEIKPFTFIALCTKQPYGVGLFTVPQDWLDLAQLQNQAILNQMRECRENPELYYPEYSRRRVPAEIPAYAQYEVELD